MKKTVSALLLLASFPAFAATYGVTGACTDPTPAGPKYVPRYDWETKVGTGAAVADNDKTTCALARAVTANPGDTIGVRARARNTLGPLTGPWTTWFTALAPVVAPTPPAALTGVVITVTPQ